MNKKIIILAILIMSGQGITAQTYYYRYTKSIVKGVEDKNDSGGQFITFDGKRCFESDKYGNNVGNGSMAYDAEVSRSTRLETYWGSCYWSKNAHMKFNADRSLMNIETNAGKIYVYKRATAPAGVTTCSLIREPERQSGGSRGGGYVPVNPVQPTYPQGGYNGSGTYNGSNTDRATRSTRQTKAETPVRQPQKKWCRNCGGTGKCRICNGTGWVHRIGIGHDGYCTSCSNHSGRCSSCNGRGEWYE
jgi:hypothetical protein